jgi:hypothetical protein
MRAIPENTAPPIDVIDGAEASHSPGPVYSTSDLLIALEARLSADPSSWREAIIETIGLWPVSSEDAHGDRFEYLIGGEAFDWRLLARRLLLSVESGPDHEEWAAWLELPEIFAGFEEPEFMRMLGVDKFRASLSYFYGVTVEQGLIVAAREEITKRRVASGRAATDDRCDEAYDRLYGGHLAQLWDDFYRESGRLANEADASEREERTLGCDDSFTYWLFKRRMERSDPARVASDTRKGLAQLERMLRAHEKRGQMLRVATRR